MVKLRIGLSNSMKIEDYDYEQKSHTIDDLFEMKEEIQVNG